MGLRESPYETQMLHSGTKAPCLSPTQVSHWDAKGILIFQQVDAVQVRLLEQPPEFGLCLCGVCVLACSGRPLPQHFLQVEDGKVGVVLFLLQEPGCTRLSVYMREAVADSQHTGQDTLMGLETSQKLQHRGDVIVHVAIILGAKGVPKPTCYSPMGQQLRVGVKPGMEGVGP